MTQGNETGSELRLGLVWIDCLYPVTAVGLTQILEGRARVHVGREAPTGEKPSLMILSTDNMEDLAESINRVREANLDAPMLVFGLRLDLQLAHAALKFGARGFIHAAMQPEQIIRALKVAKEGELAAPRELLKHLIENEHPAGLKVLSARQREILELATKGLRNAQIAKKLFLSESTVKQHLHATYKALGVANRTEAVRVMRSST